MLNKIISHHGGRIKYDALKKNLKDRGYPHLHEKVEAMGFTIVDGYVQGHVQG
jgi:hypothetical protein